MKSLHQSAFLVKTLSKCLNNTYANWWIEDIYSSSKTELAFIIKNENNQLAQINFNFSADNLLLLLPSRQGNKPRLALDQFQKSHQQQIVRFRCVQNDRVMLIELANGSLFYACFYGRRADVIYLKEEEYDSFRVKNQTIDLIKKMESPNIEFDANNWDEFWQQNRFLPSTVIDQAFSIGTAQDLVRRIEKCSLMVNDNKLVLSSENIKLNKQLEIITQFNLDFLKNFHATKRAKELESRRVKYLKSINQRLAAAQNKLLGLTNKNHFQQWADLIMSNLSILNPKLKEQALTDWVTNELVQVRLNIEKSPIENANKYYQKAKNIHKEITFLKNKIAALVEEQQNPKIPGQKTISEKQVARPYYQFEMDGYEIRVGKSAEKNDELIKNHCHKNDLWLHAKDVPGSHVIIRNPSKTNIPIPVLEYAASLAAKYSKSKGQTLAAVSFTERKYVRKNKKMLPGQVRLEKEETILIKPAD